MNVDHFDVQATMSSTTTEEQFRAMLRNLLAERLAVAIHREPKEQTVLDIVVAKSGHKLTPAAAVQEATETPSPTAPVVGALGFFPIGSTVRFSGKSVSMSTLADALAGYLQRPVFDATSLTGTYDITINFQPEGIESGSPDNGPASAPTPAGPSLFSALKIQCGLELQSHKRVIEILVVDHAERMPAGN